MPQDASLSHGFPTSDIDPFSPEFVLDPFAYHESLRAAGPMVWLNKYNVFMAPRYSETMAIISDYSTFISSAGVGLTNFMTEEPWRPPSMLLEADPPDHTRRRAVVGRILSAPNLRSFRAGFEAEANRIIDRLLDTRDVDAVTDVAQAYVLKVFPDAVGLTPEGRINLLKYGQMVFNGFGPLNDIFKASAKDVGPVSTWIMEQCRHENLEPGKLGDQVYQAVPSGQITAEEAPILVRSFLSAGVDTTVDAVGNVLWCFATHPAEWAKLKANPGAGVKKAIEEVLRYEGPFQTFFRTTSREVEIGGATVGKHEKILLSTGSANRDPRKWERPDTF
ncbi:MAG: cytochrome P450, partial [Hyphomicrobiaceae bacterium]